MYLISIIIIFQYLKHSRKRLYKGYANPEAKFSIHPKVPKTFFWEGVLAGSGCCHLHTVYAQKYIYRVLQNSSPGILSECCNPSFFFLNLLGQNKEKYFCRKMSSSSQLQLFIIGAH